MRVFKLAAMFNNARLKYNKDNLFDYEEILNNNVLKNVRKEQKQ